MNELFAGGSATVLFGLFAALSWGAADFGGGLTSRRTAVLGVVMLSQFIGLVIAAGMAIARAERIPGVDDIGWSIAAGITGAIGITALYRGLAIGRMGIVAPVTGLLGATIPVLIGSALQGLPEQPALVGIVLALLAVVLVSRVADEDGGRAGLALGVAAGVGFGLFNVTIAQVSEGLVFGPLMILRGVEAVLVGAIILVSRSSWRPPRSLVPAILLIGVFDMAGNAFYILAAQSGLIAIASTLSSLYPVVTVILATVFLRERVTRDHAAGIALAIVAIVLITSGSS